MPTCPSGDINIPVPSVTVTEPTAPVADKPVTDTLASIITVTEPTAPVADKPVTFTFASALTETVPTAPVPDNPVNDTDIPVPSVIVTEPTAPVADKPVTLTETPVPSVIVTEPTEPVQINLLRLQKYRFDHKGHYSNHLYRNLLKWTLNLGNPNYSVGGISRWKTNNKVSRTRGFVRTKI